MIPPFINPDVTSNAEKKIFDLLKESTELSEYTCLHSLGLSKHSRKRQGEIDFVLVGKNTILCLEVKGGRVERKNGNWLFKDRYGQENRKVEGPFVQVSTAMYSLKKDLEAKFGAEHGYLFGYGVLFPDIEFSTQSPEWDDLIVYDLNDSSRPISVYIERISSYWRKKTPTYHKNSNLSKSEIINYFRGDFEIATPLWAEISKTENEITQFTQEQYRALDQMEGNPRLIFTGAAGTGKTLLAIEKARRNFFSKQKTLLLCCNRLLGARLQKEVQEIDPKNDFLTASSIHKYFFREINKLPELKLKFDRTSAGKSATEIYNEILPTFFINAIEKSLIEKYDCLIIDEGQDLLCENYLLALDCLLEGGLKNGNWTVFLDPGGQAKLFNRFSLEAYKELKRLGAPEYKLDLNVRNTLQIATQATIVSGFPAGKTRIEGPRVEFKLCDNETDMALKTVELIADLISKESISPSSITLLTPHSTGTMSLFATGVKVPRFLSEMDENNITEPINEKLYYASVQSYKGLENSIIIYTDLNSFVGNYSESVNYVALTRAREKLYVLMSKNLNDEYQLRIKEFAKIKQ